MLIKNRNDATAITSRYIYMQDGNLLSASDGSWLHAKTSRLTHVNWLDQPLFVAELDGEDIYLQVLAGAQESQLTSHHGREMLAILPAAEGELLARAMQLGHWLRDHQHCGRCGQANQLHKSDYGMHCVRCTHTQYPRISPCIIVVITGPEGILLAHNTRFPDGRFSALAGFVEAGETIEAAVHREVREEVGIEICDLQYVGSQPWSFPHSLMMGFMATYESGEIMVDGIEIDEADWFTPDCLPDLPPKFSIARQLVDIGLAKSV